MQTRPQSTPIPAGRRVEISVADQRLRVYDDGQEVASYAISTSKYGLGSEPESNQTPLGEFEIGEKIGDGAAPRTIFRSREVVGVWDPAQPVDEDLVLTRILWLHGRETQNANTRERYIYIHGTNQEELIGTEASHGCVRMHNDDIVELYDMLGVGTPVTIVG